MKEAAALEIDAEQVALIGESGGACIVLGVAQMLVASGQQHLVKMMVLEWPMVGATLTGGVTPDWTSYELGTRDQDVVYGYMSTDLERQRNDPLIYPIKMSDEVIKQLPRAFILTSEFDFYRRDSSKIAARFHKLGRLIDFVVLPGLNHASPLIFPSKSKYHANYWNAL